MVYPERQYSGKICIWSVKSTLVLYSKLGCRFTCPATEILSVIYNIQL